MKTFRAFAQLPFQFSIIAGFRVGFVFTEDPSVSWFTVAECSEADSVYSTHSTIETLDVIARIALLANEGVAPTANIVFGAIAVIVEVASAPILTWSQLSTVCDTKVGHPLLTPGTSEGWDTGALTLATIESEASATMQTILGLTLVHLTQSAIIVVILAPALWLQTATG